MRNDSQIDFQKPWPVVRRALIRTVMGMLAALLSTAATAESASEALAVVDENCQGDDGGATEQCACVRDVFEAQVLSKASSPEAGLLAAYIHVDDEMAMMQSMQTMESEALQEAALLVSMAKPALESCEERVAAAPDRGEMPQGDDPRSRFIRQCASDNDRPDICACIVDKALEKLSPHELELMADMRAAESRGEDPVEAMAEERGLTDKEVKEGLTAMTGRIAGAMMAIDPMTCVNP